MVARLAIADKHQGRMMVPDIPKVESAIVEMTNDFRRAQGVDAVRREQVLDRIARKYARYLVRSGKFSHTADGQQPADRAQQGGYEFCQIAENLALHRDSRGFRTRQLAEAAMQGWKDSKGHRKNLVAPHVTEIGVAVEKAPDINQYVTVQLFGRPKALQYTFTVRNTTTTQVAYSYQGEQLDLPPMSEITHTVCQPGQLRFDDQANDGTQIVSEGASLLTQAGSRFRARRAPSGRIVIERVAPTE